jgi:hypothetical protein
VQPLQFVPLVVDVGRPTLLTHTITRCSLRDHAAPATCRWSLSPRIIWPRARMPGLGKNRTKPAHASIFRQASSDRRGLESVEVKRDGRKEEHE